MKMSRAGGGVKITIEVKIENFRRANTRKSVAQRRAILVE